MNTNELVVYLNERISYWSEVYEKPELPEERTIALSRIHAYEDVLNHLEIEKDKIGHDK